MGQDEGGLPDEKGQSNFTQVEKEEIEEEQDGIGSWQERYVGYIGGGNGDPKEVEKRGDKPRQVVYRIAQPHDFHHFSHLRFLLFHHTLHQS